MLISMNFSNLFVLSIQRCETGAVRTQVFFPHVYVNVLLQHLIVLSYLSRKIFGMLRGFLEKIFGKGRLLSNNTRLCASDVLCIAFSALRSS